MAATLGRIHFNEVDFFIRPVPVEEGKYSFTKDYSFGRIKLNFPRSGSYKMHASLCADLSGEDYFLISVYDDAFELVDRKGVLISELLQKKLEGRVALKELLQAILKSWFKKDSPDFADLFTESVYRALHNYEKIIEKKERLSGGKHKKTVKGRYRLYDNYRKTAA